MEDDASVDKVLKVLGEAEREAAVAEKKDATSWVALSGGLQSIRVALNANDGRSARVGINVVRAECQRVR